MPPPPCDAPLAEHYPALAALPADLQQTLREQHLQAVEVPAGTVLFDQGAPCRGFPLVLDGEVRVARAGAGGRSLELYRVRPGELCVASTACLFGHSLLPAEGHATQPTRLCVMDPAGFDLAVAQAPFRRFVFGIFADRLSDLMLLVEAVAFQRLDQRLAGALLGHGAVVASTHQALADELGTVREIVTRLLRRFEQHGWVALGRERIEVRDPAALRALADGRG